jgi:hypothetical protein
LSGSRHRCRCCCCRVLALVAGRPAWLELGRDYAVVGEDYGELRRQHRRRWVTGD